MAVLQTFGDRLIKPSGNPSWLKRPSVPLAVFGRDGLAMTPDGRITSFLGLYESHTWVATVVNKIRGGIMDLPLHLYRTITDDGEVEPVHTHPLLDLIASPGARMSPAKFSQKISFPMLVHGNGVIAKVRQTPNGPPVGFQPLDWRFLIPWTLDDGEVFFWESTQQGRRQFYDPSDVLHFAFEAGNGDLGVSPLKQLGTTLGSETATQQHQASSFQHGARPSGALKTAADLSAAQRAELRQEINSAPPGDFFLLSGGMEWQAFSHTAVEAELIDQRKLNREEVAAVYDIDPVLIGILDHGTYSNMTEAYERFYSSTLRPWLTLICDTLNAQLIDPEPGWTDERLFFGYDLADVLRSDTPEQIAAIASAVASAMMTPNEGRQRIKLRTSDNPAADELYIPSNNLKPLGQEPEPLLPALPVGGNGNGQVPEPVKANCLRALERAAKRMSIGLDPFDRARFVRELGEDAPDVDAGGVADQVEGLIQLAMGDSQECRRLASIRFR